MKKLELFTESNCVTVFNNRNSNMKIKLSNNKAETAAVFEREDKASLIKFFQSVIDELHKETKF